MNFRPRRPGSPDTEVQFQIGAHPESDHMLKTIKNFWTEESGQGLTEYALIIALVAIGLIAILVLFRNSIGNVFNTSRNTLNNAPGNSY